jgi:Holliday junction resolvase
MWVDIMTKIKEGSLVFQFDSSVSAVKYDDLEDYKKYFSATGFKAVDIIAIYNNNTYLIEVKDCATDEKANETRLEEKAHTPELEKVNKYINLNSITGVKATRKKIYILEEIIQKFKDTIAAITTKGDFSGIDRNSILKNIEKSNTTHLALYWTSEEDEFKRTAQRLTDKINQKTKKFGVVSHVIHGMGKFGATDHVFSVDSLNIKVSRET